MRIGLVRSSLRRPRPTTLEVRRAEAAWSFEARFSSRLPSSRSEYASSSAIRPLAREAPLWLVCTPPLMRASRHSLRQWIALQWLRSEEAPSAERFLLSACLASPTGSAASGAVLGCGGLLNSPRSEVRLQHGLQRIRTLPRGPFCELGVNSVMHSGQKRLSASARFVHCEAFRRPDREPSHATVHTPLGDEALCAIRGHTKAEAKLSVVAEEQSSVTRRDALDHLFRNPLPTAQGAYSSCRVGTM